MLDPSLTSRINALNLKVHGTEYCAEQALISDHLASRHADP